MDEVFDMSLNTDHYVVMSNDLVKGKQRMGRKESKLLRLVIMQAVMEDKDFKTYKVDIKELAKTLGIDSSNLYRETKEICKNLLSNVVEIGDGNPKHKWKAFQWVSRCKYDGQGTLEIQLHDDLKPYLLGLGKWYTQYTCESILHMNSVYAIRVYELIFMEIKNKKIGNGITVDLSVEMIRKACDCENKLKKISQFKEKVIDVSLREINANTDFFISTEPYKKSKTIIGYKFLINYKWNIVNS